jgi:hypothetical protein
MNFEHTTKLKAFLIHLGLSSIILVILLYLLFFHWYPGFYFHADGGWQGLRIILGVDMVLGPLLTLIIYKQGKPGLKFDLTFIGIVQISSLIYGVGIVYTERPIALVFADKNFYSMSPNAYRFWEISPDIVDQFPTNNWPLPIIYTDLPTDDKALNKLRFESLLGNPLHTRTSLYQPYGSNSQKALPGALSVEKLRARHKEDPKQVANIDAWLQQFGRTESDVVFVPFTTRDSNAFLGLDAENGKILGYIDPTETFFGHPSPK